MATAAVGKLWVGLDLKTKAFEGGLKKGVAKTKEASTKMKSSFSSVFSGVALGNLASAGIKKAASIIVSVMKKTFDWIKSQIVKVFSKFDELDLLAKTARRLNISTKALTAWGRAADHAGVGAAKLADALSEMQIKLGDAATFGGGAGSKLKQIGLDAQLLANMPMDKAILEIAEAFSKVESGYTKARIAQELFGGSGKEMLLLMEGGAKGLRDAIAEADKMGITFNEGMLKGLEDFNDLWADVNKTTDATFKTLAVGIAPHLKSIVKDMNEVFGTGVNQGNLIGIADMAGNAIHLLSGYMQATIGKWQDAAARLIDVAIYLIEAFEKFTGVEIADQESLRKKQESAALQAQKNINNGWKKVQAAISGEYLAGIRAEREAANAERKKNKVKPPAPTGRKLVLPKDITVEAVKAMELSTPTTTPAAALIKGSAEAYSFSIADKLQTEEQRRVEKREQFEKDIAASANEMIREMRKIANQIKPNLVTIGP